MAQITGGPHRGHAAGDTDAEKAASQLVSDIKYKVGLELEKKGGASHMNPAQVAQMYMQKLNASPAPGPVKAIAKKKLGGGGLKEEYNINKLAQESVVNALNKVFVEGIEEPVAPNEYLLQLEETEEKKYKIRVTDKKTGNTYVRMATRAKIAELRANPNISSVEMTSYGEPSETEKTTGSKTAAAKAGKDYDGDGKTESPAKEYRGSVHNAIQRKKGGTPDGKDTSSVKEEFIGEVNGEKAKKKIGDGKVNNGKYVNLKPTLSTMESVAPEPSTLQKFQTQQKPNPAVEAKNKQVVQIQKKQLTDKMAQLNKGVPLTSSYQPEGELVDEKLATQYGNPNKLSQSSQRKSLGKGSSIKDGSKPSGYESPREFRDTESKYQKNSFEPEGENVQEVAPPGMEGTVKAMKKHKEIDNPYALAWSMKNRGYKSHRKANGDMKEAASCDGEKTEISNEDPRSIKTKANLIKNKLRAMGLKMSYEPEGNVVSEEESDRIRDRQLERGGMGARASQSPAKTGSSKPFDPKKHQETTKKAMDLVRQSIIARHGKGALI
jgi:hypothetical protein